MSETATTARIPANLSLVAPADEHPRYTHDCDCCHFLGRMRGDDGEVDLYAHTGGHMPTVIARFGDDGPEYTSGACFSYGTVPELTEARRRAQALGLWEYRVKEALFYCKPEDDACRQELRAALPFTLEYQAFLAWEQGNSERHEGLVTHLIQVELARARKYDAEASRFSAVASVQQAITRVVATYRGMADREAMFDEQLQGTTEFALTQALAELPAEA